MLHPPARESPSITNAGFTYVYDGDGKRVEKYMGSTGTLYWTGIADAAVGETDLSGNLSEEYFFFNGMRVARRDYPSNTVHFYLNDPLGSARQIVTPTSATAATVEESDFDPYGAEFVITGSDTNHYKFEGKERDTETNLDNFGARYYANAMGRFMTPDWAARPAVPYAVFGDPQSLNLYGFVRNDPVTRADADGHCTDPVSCGLEFAGFGTVIEPGGGTAVGAVLGTVVGAGVLYFGGKAIVDEIHRSDNNNEQQPATTSSGGQTPSRTAQDELPRDANGKPVPDADAAGAAHTQLGTRQSRSKPGTSYPQSREFDKNGKPVKDIDHTDHGRSDHTNPHQHPYDPNTGKRLPQEPVTPTPPQPPPPPPPKPTGT